MTKPTGRKRTGRPRKYPINTIPIGGTILIPWLVEPSGEHARHQRPLMDAIRQEQNRFGKKFSVIGQARGLLVHRVK